MQLYVMKLFCPRIPKPLLKQRFKLAPFQCTVLDFGRCIINALAVSVSLRDAIRTLSRSVQLPISAVVSTEIRNACRGPALGEPEQVGTKKTNERSFVVVACSRDSKAAICRLRSSNRRAICSAILDMYKNKIPQIKLLCKVRIPSCLPVVVV
jgi:hypothetical protein